MKHLLFLLLGFYILSCQDLKKDGQLRKVGDLHQKLVKMSKELAAGKTDSTQWIIRSTEKLEWSIRENYASDTISLELGEKLKAYKMIRRQLTPLLKLEPELEKQLADEAKALEKLKQDIEQSAGDKAKYDEYLTFEKNKTEELERGVKNLQETRRQCFAAYERLHMDMERFAEDLNKETK
ncbi:MAG: hypothetical protein ACO1O6_11625 [Bacteroidota bacterium]